MSRIAFAAAVAVALALPAGAPAAVKVDVMVVGKTRTLDGPRSVSVGKAAVAVGRERCRVGPGPLAALARMDVKVTLKDYGACSKKPADGTGLYVRAVDGERGRGADGWVYKINNKAPSSGAGDPASKLRAGDRVLWYWCAMGPQGCQRTLVASPAAVQDGQARVKVTAYDGGGKGRPASGATVTAGGATATADASGVATIAAAPGARVVATADGMIRSFPAKVPGG